MRNLVLVLVLINLGFAAWSAWYAAPDTAGTTIRDSRAAGIVLVSELEAAALKSSEALGFAAPALRPPPLPVTASVASDRCISVGPFQELAQASAAQASLRNAGFMPTQRVEDGDIWVGYWVYLTDIPTRALADEILERLRENDVSDSYIVPGSEETETISLGVFSEISRAGDLREQVRALGYEPTVEDRGRRAALYWIDVPASAGATIDLDALQPPGRINRLEQRACAGGTG